MGAWPSERAGRDCEATGDRVQAGSGSALRLPGLRPGVSAGEASPGAGVAALGAADVEGSELALSNDKARMKSALLPLLTE